MSTLHPQLLGFTANWRADLGTVDEAEVFTHIRETPDYLASPLRIIIEEGLSVRLDPQDPGARAAFPIIATLGEAGYTDYWGFPLRRSNALFSLMTLATREPGGFSPAAVAAIEALTPLFALNVESVSRGKLAENILDAYLGRRSGRQVLAGDIVRGSGETIDAIVWMSDMRDFTGLSDRLSGGDMVRLLNAYFERLVAAVRGQGGEVLKFIGDGLLAIFPVSDGRSARTAAEAALAAARMALADIDSLDAATAEFAAIEPSWQPLDMGVALHRGPVFFGNIGARDRLDFTVIGPAVNLAARVEPLTKETGHRLLMTRNVADLLDAPLANLGEFRFRGLPQPVTVFAAPETLAA